MVIATLDDDTELAASLETLVGAAVDGLVREVIVADGGSTDATLAVADEAGAKVVPTSPGLYRQLAAGCAEAKGEWLLILLAGVRLAQGWERAIEPYLAGEAEVVAVTTPPATGFWDRIGAFFGRHKVEVVGLLLPRDRFRAGGASPEFLESRIDLAARPRLPALPLAEA